MDVLNCGQLGLGNGEREEKGTPAAPCPGVHGSWPSIMRSRGAHSGAVFDRVYWLLEPRAAEM